MNVINVLCSSIWAWFPMTLFFRKMIHSLLKSFILFIFSGSHRVVMMLFCKCVFVSLQAKTRMISVLIVSDSVTLKPRLTALTAHSWRILSWCFILNMLSFWGKKLNWLTLCCSHMGWHHCRPLVEIKGYSSIQTLSSLIGKSYMAAG